MHVSNHIIYLLLYPIIVSIFFLGFPLYLFWFIHPHHHHHHHRQSVNPILYQLNIFLFSSLSFLFSFLPLPLSFLFSHLFSINIPISSASRLQAVLARLGSPTSFLLPPHPNRLALWDISPTSTHMAVVIISIEIVWVAWRRPIEEQQTLVLIRGLAAITGPWVTILIQLAFFLSCLWPPLISIPLPPSSLFSLAKRAVQRVALRRLVIDLFILGFSHKFRFKLVPFYWNFVSFCLLAWLWCVPLVAPWLARQSIYSYPCH